MPTITNWRTKIEKIIKNQKSKKKSIRQIYRESGAKLTPMKPQTKKPLHANWQKEPVDIEWFGERPDCNVGLLTGTISEGLVDIDLDHELASKLATRILPETSLRFGRDSNPNSHWLYRVIDTPGSRKTFEFGNHGMLVEYRADGCCTVAPPSVHPSGEMVEFKAHGSPAEFSREDLLKYVGELAAATLIALNWNRGSRHTIALALSGVLLRAGWTGANTEWFITAICEAVNDEETADRLHCVTSSLNALEKDGMLTGWPTLAKTIGEDVAAKVTDWLGLSKKQVQAPTLAPSLDDLELGAESQTDLGNAKRFAKQNKDTCFYNSDQGQWYNWNGGVWKKTASTTIQKLAYKTAESIFEEGGTDTNLVTWAKSSCSKQRLEAMISLARPFVGRFTSELNTDPMLFNVSNVTIDLRTGEAREQEKSNLIDQQATVVFDQDAQCPRFQKFISEIFNGDDELATYVQKVLGYSLSANTSEQKMFLLFGNGANGKGTLTQTLQSIMGSYAATAQAQTLMQKPRASGSEASPDIARLVDVRSVFISEGDQSHKFDEALVKQLTGQDRITARALHKNPFEFEPSFKLLLSTNYLPKVRGSDHGIWRRLAPIPFEVSFEGKRIDKELGAKLEAEKSGILNWMIDGCLLWQKEGLEEPKAVLNAKEVYRSNSDNILRFLGEKTVKGINETVSKADLYSAYREWAQSQGEHFTVSNREFSDVLSKQQGIDEKRSKNARLWKGLRMIMPYDAL